jgi:hypothetical protein
MMVLPSRNGEPTGHRAGLDFKSGVSRFRVWYRCRASEVMEMRGVPQMASTKSGDYPRESMNVRSPCALAGLLYAAPLARGGRFIKERNEIIIGGQIAPTMKASAHVVEPRRTAERRTFGPERTGSLRAH